MSTTLLFTEQTSAPYSGYISNDLSEIFFFPGQRVQNQAHCTEKLFALGFKINVLSPTVLIAANTP